MLNQLRLAGVLKKAAAIVLGQFTDCDDKDLSSSWSLQEVFNDYFGHLDIPVYSGLAAGHDERKITIPIGVEVKIIDDKLIFVEDGVRE